MAAVTGSGGKNLSPEQAFKSIFGYMIFNDVSYSDIRLSEKAFGVGPTKGSDADHGNVLGPWLVTADEVGGPQDLKMIFIVSGWTISSYHTIQDGLGASPPTSPKARLRFLAMSSPAVLFRAAPRSTRTFICAAANASNCISSASARLPARLRKCRRTH